MNSIGFHPAAKKFIDGLQPSVRAKLLNELDFLEEYGRLLPPPYSKKISRDLFELRARGEVQVRLLYGFRNNEPVILHGFVKKSPKIPMRELRLAEKRFASLA